MFFIHDNFVLSFDTLFVAVTILQTNSNRHGVSEFVGFNVPLDTL